MMEIDGESPGVSICVLDKKKKGEILVGICQDECVNYKLRVISTIFFDISRFGLNMQKKCYIWI
jgi:hypothetical protein